MTHLVLPDAGVWVWLVVSMATFAILAILSAMFWIRDRRPPRLILGWLGAWVLLHVVPLIGILCMLDVLYLSARSFVAHRTAQT